MSAKEVPESHCTPTDPSLEFDVFEVVRTRLVDALLASRYDRVDAERIALYATEGLHRVPRFLKVLTKAEAPGREEVVEALARVLDEIPALEKAKRILLHQDQNTAEGNEKAARSE